MGDHRRGHHDSDRAQLPVWIIGQVSAADASITANQVRILERLRKLDDRQQRITDSQTAIEKRLGDIYGHDLGRKLFMEQKSRGGVSMAGLFCASFDTGESLANLLLGQVDRGGDQFPFLGGRDGNTGNCVLITTVIPTLYSASDAVAGAVNDARARVV